VRAKANGLVTTELQDLEGRRPLDCRGGLTLIGTACWRHIRASNDAPNE